MRLEYLHDHSDDMEYRDHSDFSPGFEPCHDEKYLEGYSHEKKKIISVQDTLEWIVILRHDDHEYEKKSKNTRICLSVDEYEEVVKERIHTIF